MKDNGFRLNVEFFADDSPPELEEFISVGYRFIHEWELYGDYILISNKTSGKEDIIKGIGLLAQSAMKTYLELREKEEAYEHVHEDRGKSAENTGAEEAGGAGGQAKGAGDERLHARADRDPEEVPEEP